jgi:hypothetical protein
MLKFKGKDVLVDLEEKHRNISYERVQLAAFAALAARDYFGQSRAYCNTITFTLYGRSFSTPDRRFSQEFRKTGGYVECYGIDPTRLVVSIPQHVYHTTSTAVRLDQRLLSALVKYCRESSPQCGRKYLHAIECFNMANTDDDNTDPAIEHVLLCSAFQRILGEWDKAQWKGKATAEAFAEAFMPTRPVAMQNATGRCRGCKNPDLSVRYSWMEEFCDLRGDFAHGTLTREKPSDKWTPQEHRLLAVIVFPLLIKCLLRKEGCYRLTEDDRKRIEIFERFADSADFYDKDRRGQYPWTRLLERELDPVVKNRWLRMLRKSSAKERS